MPAPRPAARPERGVPVLLATLQGDRSRAMVRREVPRSKRRSPGRRGRNGLRTSGGNMKSHVLAGALIAACALRSAPARAQESPPPAPPSNAQDESSDSGLGLEWVWLNADVGVSYVGLDSLNSSNFQVQNTKSVGPVFGVGAGVRLFFLTLGVRARDVPLSELNLWELNGEAAFHTRFDRFDPYIGVRGGYAFDGSLSSGTVQAVQGQPPPGVNVHGWDVGPILGCDYYFNHYFSLGID